MDAMKILGGLLGGGGASSGLGGQLIGSLLQGATGSGSSGGGLGGALGGALGSALGGSGGGAGGGLGGLLGSALGGSSGGRGSGLGGVLGGVAMTALAGYMARGSSSGAGATASRAAPPPPPQESSTANQQAELLVRAMLSAAKSDGRIDANEEAKIFERLGDLDEAEKAFLRREMQAPVDASALARDVPNGSQAEVYAISVLAIELDDQSEAQYLAELAQALGLSGEQCNQIHAQLGAPEIFN